MIGENAATLRPVGTRKTASTFRAGNQIQEPYLPYLLSLLPHLLSKEPYLLSKEPYLLSKEAYLQLEEA